MTGGTRTLSNILSQPEAWAALAAGWSRQAQGLPSLGGVERVVFTGCGSAWFASQALTHTATALLGLPAQAIPASEVAFYPDITFAAGGRTLLVALSRSGQTSETREAVRAFRSLNDGLVWALTVRPASDLARAADFTLDASAGEEDGIVQTRSLTTMLLCGLAALTELGPGEAAPALNRLPEAAQRVIEAAHPLAERLGSDPAIERFFWLGAGPWRGIASESMLKIKEMSHAQCEAFHPLEFRHGLGANADSRSLIVGYLSERAADAERAVLDEFRATQGVRTVELSVDAGASGDRAGALSMPDELPEWARLVLALPFAQLMAVYRARLNGLNPDEPLNLKPFIALEGPLG